MEEGPPIAESFEERRKIFRDIWDSSDSNDPEDNNQKPKVIKYYFSSIHSSYNLHK